MPKRTPTTAFNPYIERLARSMDVDIVATHDGKKSPNVSLQQTGVIVTQAAENIMDIAINAAIKNKLKTVTGADVRLA